MESQTYREKTIEQLVIRYQQCDDKRCFGELYRRFYPKIFQYSLGLCRDRDIAFDVTQDVFVSAAENLYRLRYPVTFPNWLFRIAHNTGIDYCKIRKRRRCMPIEHQFDLIQEEPDLEYLQEKEEIFDTLQEAMQDVDAECRKILELKYMEDQSIRTLQKKYQASESAIKMRLARARKKVAICYHEKVEAA